MNKTEVIQIVDSFLNEHGLWFSFQNWLKEREDLTPSDLGFEED